MKGLVVDVTGKSYKLGDVPVGATKSCRVNPIGESSVKISYTQLDGTKKHHDINCYLESGYRGSIHAECNNGELFFESFKTSITQLY